MLIGKDLAQKLEKDLDKEVTKLNSPNVRGTWVQAERASLEKLAELNRDHPKAATLMLMLMANMDNQGGLVVSQQTLADFCQCGLNTIKRAIAVLIEGNWIETLSIGKGRGSTLAYFVNNRVAWADKRDKLEYAHVNARVILAKSDQEEIRTDPLIKLPVVGPGDGVIPHGDGIAPPAQAEFDETLAGIPTAKVAQVEGTSPQDFTTDAPEQLELE
jgi:hypothetical protein